MAFYSFYYWLSLNRASFLSEDWGVIYPNGFNILNIKGIMKMCILILFTKCVNNNAKSGLI